jgi:BirA family biotin operon repressor/biotin-[acetyl-CoA-carboxylase] ligase
VVVAGIQTKGRGRLKRQWLSPSGGLYFTMVLKPEIPSALSHRLNFAASYTLACTFREMFGIDAKVKWPNDILVNDAKLVGILSELETESDMVSFVNIGIGINANNDTSRVDQKAISLKALLGRDVSRKEILARFLAAFFKRLSDEDLEDIIDRWKEHNATLGRKVRIVTMTQEIEGRAVDVDDDGALLLELKSGESQRITYGDCFHTDA